jgi:hypothetical protein
VRIGLSSVDDANREYVLLASARDLYGFPTCGGNLPIDADLVWHASLTNPGVFQNFQGTLDWAGTTTAPRVAVPNQVGFVGFELHLAYVTLDVTQPCWVRSASSKASFTIQP